MYPLAASSGLLRFTILEVLPSVPYGVRAIKNGSGSPALSEPPGRRNTTCSFTPSRIGIIASLRVYSFDSAFCGASCALSVDTEIKKHTERTIAQQSRIFMKQPPQSEIKIRRKRSKSEDPEDASYRRKKPPETR